MESFSREIYIRRTFIEVSYFTAGASCPGKYQAYAFTSVCIADGIVGISVFFRCPTVLVSQGSVTRPWKDLLIRHKQCLNIGSSLKQLTRDSDHSCTAVKSDFHGKYSTDSDI